MNEAKNRKSFSGPFVITGLSGAGKSVLSRSLEDIGYVCVDNIPLELVPSLFERTEGEMNRLVVVLDIRTQGMIQRFPEFFRELKENSDPPPDLCRGVAPGPVAPFFGRAPSPPAARAQPRTGDHRGTQRARRRSQFRRYHLRNFGAVTARSETTGVGPRRRQRRRTDDDAGSPELFLPTRGAGYREPRLRCSVSSQSVL